MIITLSLSLSHTHTHTHTRTHTHTHTHAPIKARTDFKNEYEILSSLSPHKNIVRLYAFFYDRPKVHPKLRECGDGMALCMLMEQLSQNMQQQLDVLCRGTGPNVSEIEAIR